MFKIITLVVVVFAVILLHEVYGGVYRRWADDDVTTRVPKLIRVPLKRYDPMSSQTLDVAPVSRHRRDAQDAQPAFDVMKRGPLDLESPLSKIGYSDNSPEEISEDSKPSEELSRSDAKGFEAREQEEKLAENEESEVVDDQVPEATEGRAPIDDEKERFDVGSSSPKSMKKGEEIEETNVQKLS